MTCLETSTIDELTVENQGTKITLRKLPVGSAESATMGQDASAASVCIALAPGSDGAVAEAVFDCGEDVSEEDHRRSCIARNLRHLEELVLEGVPTTRDCILIYFDIRVSSKAATPPVSSTRP
jgi:hypothetical protein